MLTPINKKIFEALELIDLEIKDFRQNIVCLWTESNSIRSNLTILQKLLEKISLDLIILLQFESQKQKSLLLRASLLLSQSGFSLVFFLVERNNS